MHLRRLIAIAFALAVAADVSFRAAPSYAASSETPVVSWIGDTFVKQLPSGWTATQGGWEFTDVIACWTSNTNCFGNNPSGPYGYPTLPGASGSSGGFQLNPNDAIVIIMRTPPRMRYFGFTQYLFNRPGYVYPLFASLSDTLNLKKFVAVDSPAAGQDVFDRIAVVVWAADLNTLDMVRSTLLKQNIQSKNVNFIPLPINLPLRMGIGPLYDTYGMLMRTALPEDQARLDSYMTRKPFYVVKVSRNTVGPANPAPTIGYASEISGIVENASLQSAFDNLVSDVKSHYAGKFVFASQNVSYDSKLGLTCIQLNQACVGDNHDDLFTTDGQSVQFVKSNDIFLVAGVNHRRTGKVLYTNISIKDTVHNAGIVAVSDDLLTTDSALYHAGVTSPNDPRIAQYRDLYVYAISYDCGDMQYCLNIPPPTADNPVGLTPLQPFVVNSRAYVDLTTLVRPSTQEIIKHQAFIGTHK